MKKVVFAVIALLALNAKADGFVCKTAEGDLKIKVFNHTQPEAGTRNAAIVVLSAPSVSAGNKTIARFTDAESELTSEGALYEITNFTEFHEQGGGEYLLGTRLGFVTKMVVSVDFNYSRPVRSGATVEGDLAVWTETQGLIQRKLECARYLKN